MTLKEVTELDNDDFQKIIDLNRYIPDLNEEEIKNYLDIGKNINNLEFIQYICRIQEEKNNTYTNIEEVLTTQKKDDDFLVLFDKKDKLLKIDSNFCFKPDICNFISSHCTNIILDNTSDKHKGISGEKIGITRESLGLPKTIKSLGAEIKTLPKFSNITYNPDGLYYKDWFFPLYNIIKSLSLFWIEFLNTYGEFYKENVSFKISLRLDHPVSLDLYRRIGLSGGLYYGRPYTEESLFIKGDKSFLTKYTRDECVKEILGDDISYIEVFFNQDEGSLQIEEITNIQNEEGDFIHRYIHCKFNRDKKLITHFDGAILVYNKIGHKRRLETSLDKHIHTNSEYIKLFKIDGDNDKTGISIAYRKKLTISFFENNEIVMSVIDNESYIKYLDYMKLSDYEKYMKRENDLIENFEKNPKQFILNPQFLTFIMKKDQNSPD